MPPRPDMDLQEGNTKRYGPSRVEGSIGQLKSGDTREFPDATAAWIVRIVARIDSLVMVTISDYADS